jgi:hypothetical protein
MFSSRTNLILSMVIVGFTFLTIAWVGMVIGALDDMDGKNDSNIKFHMLWITALFIFVEHSMWKVLPPSESSAQQSSVPSGPSGLKK